MFRVRQTKALLGPACVLLLGLGFTLTGGFVVWQLGLWPSVHIAAFAFFSVMTLTGIVLIGIAAKLARDVFAYDTVVLERNVLELRR